MSETAEQGTVTVPRWVLYELIRMAHVEASLVRALRDHGDPQPRAFPDDEAIEKGDRAIAAAYEAMNGPMSESDSAP